MQRSDNLNNKMKITNYKKYIIPFLLIFFININNAFSASFTASVNNNNVEVGEQVQITFKVDKNKVSGFKPPTFKGFSVLMGPSQSSYTQIINGNVSQSFSYSYVLRAEAPGEYEIGAAQINVDGNVLRSNPIKIKVSKSKNKQQQQVAPGSSQQNQQQNQQQQEKTLSKEANDLISKHLFVRLNVNKNQAYQGEPVYATYRLYINPELNVLSASAPKQPMFNGFWSQEFKIDQIQYSGSETINGINYRYADIAKVLLIPQQIGNLTIEPFEMEFIVRLRVQNQKQRQRDPWGFDDFFDDPFFGGANYRDFKYIGKSATGKLNVLPLPEPIPEYFANGVGSYKFTASIDKNKVKTNEPFSLKYKVEGMGNLKLVQPPILNLSKDLEQFDPKFDENINITSAGMIGDKTFEYIIIPRSPGNYTIPSVSFVYFDYNQKRYFTINSEEFSIEVEKGMYQDINSNYSDVNRDIKFIKDNTTLNQNNRNFLNSIWFYIFSSLPILTFIFIFLYKRKKENDELNIAQINNKNAAKYAKKRLSGARKYLDMGSIPEFYEELHRAMLEYFSNKFDIKSADLSKDNIQNIMIQNGYESESEKTYKILELCEMARYTPYSQIENAQYLLTQSEEVIMKMEQRRK